MLQAEILRGLLEANGIQVMLSAEGAGRAIGLGSTPLANVQLLVAEADQSLAKQLLADYYAGRLDPGL